MNVVIDKEMIDNAWKFAIYYNEVNRTNAAMEWTGIAKTLEELAGIRSWGIIDKLKNSKI